MILRIAEETFEEEALPWSIRSALGCQNANFLAGTWNFARVIGTRHI
jgi:hypothetical protein